MQPSSDASRKPRWWLGVLGVLFFLAVLVGLHWAQWHGMPMPEQAARQALETLTQAGADLDLHGQVNRLYPPGYPHGGPLAGSTARVVLQATSPIDICRQRWVEEMAPNLGISLLALVGVAGWWCFLLLGTGRRSALSRREYLVLSGIVLLLAALPQPVGLALTSFFLLLVAAAQWREGREPTHVRALSRTLGIAVLALVLGMLVVQLSGPRLAQGLLRLAGERMHYQYATDGQSYWILQSTGPNRVLDLDLSFAAQRAAHIPSATDITRLTYDPTNGPLSRGDVLVFGGPHFSQPVDDEEDP